MPCGKCRAVVVPSSVQLPHIDRCVLEADRIGVAVRFEDYAQALKSNAAMVAHDRHVCEVLQASGRIGFEDRELYRVCMVTGAAQRLETFKRRRILQTVMASELREMKTELEAFLDGWADKGQMLVLSAGEIGLDVYRETHERFGQAIGDLATKLKQHFGQTMQFANTENKYHRRVSGDLRLHMHSHAIITGKYMDPVLYEKLKQYIKDHMKRRGFRAYCHMSPLRRPDESKKKGHRGTVSEAIKYSFAPDKADENVKLREDEIVDLADATFRLKFYRPMGDFLEFRKELEAKTWVDLEDAVDPITGEVELHPLTGEPVKRWKTVRQAGKRVLKRRDPKTGRVTFVTVSRDTREAAHQKRNDSGADTDIVLGGQLPAPWAGTRMTPSFIVARYKGNFADLVRKRRLEDRVNEVRRLWNARVRQDGRPDLAVALLAKPAARRSHPTVVGHITANSTAPAAVPARIPPPGPVQGPLTAPP